MNVGEVKKTGLRRGFAYTMAACLLSWSVGTVGALAGPAAESWSAEPGSSGGGFTGGLRGEDGTGAVEKDAQKASDLPAGTCAVSSADPSGSQAGFTWFTSEPGSDSPDKTVWGLSTSFDNSKDRTFADWDFSNSGLLYWSPEHGNGAFHGSGSDPSRRQGAGHREG